jgi:hypothetical protein
MMFRKSLFLIGAAILATGTAHADPITLTGNYLQVSISDYGTFGLNGGQSPAFVHDPAGMGDFDYDTDYIAPGTPHDGFSMIADQFGFTQNDNAAASDFGFTSPTLLTGSAARGYANAASWSGTLAGFLTVTNSYFFNPGDERVLIETTITALSDLTNLAFARSVDPDSGTTESINQRGNEAFGIDDFIGSESTANGRTLALVNILSPDYANTTSINADCCSNINPYDVLNHTGDDLGLTSTGDHGLNLAYLIGALNSGQTATFQYAYAAGLGLDDIEPTPAVPEPASWAMMIAGFGLVGGAMRRRPTTSVTFA